MPTTPTGSRRRTGAQFDTSARVRTAGTCICVRSRFRTKAISLRGFDGFRLAAARLRSVFNSGQVLRHMARADTGDSDSGRREIRLVEEEDGRWSAIDEGVGVASQGETRSGALANLDEAVALHRGAIGEPVTDADLRDLGIDPDTVPDEPQEPDAPWFSE